MAVAYLRTSSPTNASKGLASDKDSDKRQRVAIEGFTKSNGYEIVDEFYDVVSGGHQPIREDLAGGQAESGARPQACNRCQG